MSAHPYKVGMTLRGTEGGEVTVLNIERDEVLVLNWASWTQERPWRIRIDQMHMTNWRIPAPAAGEVGK